MPSPLFATHPDAKHPKEDKLLRPISATHITTAALQVIPEHTARTSATPPRRASVQYIEGCMPPSPPATASCATHTYCVAPSGEALFVL